MKTILSILFLFLFFTGLTAQEKNEDKPDFYSTAPNFYIDILNYQGKDTGKTRVDVFIQVPYPNVQFVRSGDKFTGQYSVTLTIFDKDKENTLKTNVWDETLTAYNFNQTASPNNFNLSLRSFELDPGQYLLRCTVEDADSKRNVRSEHFMEVLSFTDSISISDLLLVNDIVETESGRKIVPNVTQIVKSMDKMIQFYYQVYSDKERETKIVYSINDKNKNQNYTQSITKKLSQGMNEITDLVQYPNFTFGEYELTVVVRDSTDKLLAGIGKSFFAEAIGIPGSIDDLDEAVEQMRYIADSDDLDSIKAADGFQDKLNRFLSFWRAKDPTPNTKINEYMIEYFKRVEYADKNFEAYKVDGWRTDMGMVYISLGPPDYIDRHPFALDSKPYEVWDYYNLNRRFVFVDYTGFGDYRLLEKDYRDLNRYRY